MFKVQLPLPMPKEAKPSTKPLHSKRALGSVAGGAIGLGSLFGPLPQIVEGFHNASTTWLKLQANSEAEMIIIVLCLVILVQSAYMLWTKFYDYHNEQLQHSQPTPIGEEV